ncbi:MAG: cytochrome b/b6 domain-containing protein [Bacteriovoracia bacterium]
MIPALWSWPTRILHWGMAIAITVDYFADGGDPLHNWSGYLALGVVVIRFAWGFFAADEANFRNFPLSPSLLIDHMKGFIVWKHKDYSGHNPLASWAYVFMWLLVVGLGISGYLLGTDRFWGDETLDDAHEYMADSLLVLIAFHLAGIVIDAFKFKRKTWMGMITGKRNSF